MPYKISYISDIYGKPFYYLLCKIDILNVISDILYRISNIVYQISNIVYKMYPK